jgi:hypothetical protein
VQLAEARLEEPQLGVLTLARATGLPPLTLQIGGPEVRTSVQTLPQANGVDDYTAWFGARAVTLTLGVNGADEGGPAEVSSDTLLRRVAAYQRPDRRPVLAYRWVGDSDMWRLALVPRGMPRSHQLSELAYPLAVTQWAAPFGVIEAYEARSVTVLAELGDPGGRVYDLEFPRAYPGGGSKGRTLVDYDGTVPADFVARLYGPVTNPVFGNETTDELLSFTANGGLVIAAGEYVEVDTRGRTVLLNSDAGSSRYDRLDTGSLRWPRLHPGPNSIRYNGTATASPAQAELTYRPAYL